MTHQNLRTYFGHELAFWRRKKGLTQAALAHEVGYALKTVQGVEQGLRAPQQDLCRRLDVVLDLDGVLARLGERARADLTPWGSFREFEQRADTIREFNNHVVPGLLQTEAYARAVIAAITPWLDVEDEVADRLARQDRLHADHPPQVHVIIAEAVLDQPIGGAAAWRKQLERLVSPGPAVSVRVLPAAGRPHPGLGGPFTLADLPEGDQMAFADSQGPGGMVDDAEHLARFERAWEWIGVHALPVELSAEWIAAVMEDIP